MPQSSRAMRVEIPGLKLVSEANEHEFWRARQKRAAEQNRLVGLVLRTRRPVPVPCEVHVVRVAPAALDTDNLAGSAKHVRDAVAKWLGIDDRDERVTWHVGQTRARGYATRIVVRPWSPLTVGARTRVEGDATRVEVALTGPQRAALARALTSDTTVTLALAGLHLTLHTATPPKGTP